MDTYKSACPPNKSILVFDLDDTVLEKTKTGTKALGKKPTSSQLLKSETLSQYTGGDLKSAELYPAQASGIFNNSEEFFDEEGKPAKEGLFTLHAKTPEQKIALVQTQNPEQLKKLLFYKDGFILASHQSKGLALKRFLEMTNTLENTQCIFFADDLNENDPRTGSTANHDDMKAAFKTIPEKNLFRYQFPTAPKH